MKRHVLFVATILCAGGLVTTLAMAWISRPLPTLEAELEVPESVTLGKQFELVIVTENTDDQPIRLDSIDVDFGFLDGFEVVTVHPLPTDTIDIPGQRSWAFDRDVAPGRKLVVTFKLEAVQLGNFSGDIDVCNPNQDFTTVVPDIEVTTPTTAVAPLR